MLSDRIKIKPDGGVCINNSKFRGMDFDDWRVYSLKEPEVYAHAVEAWGSEVASSWRDCGAYYSVNYDYFVDKNEPDLGGHVLAPWWRSE